MTDKDLTPRVEAVTVENPLAFHDALGNALWYALRVHKRAIRDLKDDNGEATIHEKQAARERAIDALRCVRRDALNMMRELRDMEVK